MRRDVARIQQRLVESGRAYWLSSEQVTVLGQRLRPEIHEEIEQRAVVGGAQAELAAAASAVRRLVTMR